MRRVIGCNKMEKGSQNWNPESLSKEFLAKAEACRQYLREVKAKLRFRRSYEFIFDQTLAEFYVFNSLHGKSFLATRDDLLARLRSLLELEVPKEPEALDFERFKIVRRNIIETLIRRFERDG
jgi:hypothetical protein